jgi:hypothetical protein
MGWIELIVQFLKLGMLILNEIYAAKKRAREAQEKYEITQDIFHEIVLKCIERLKTESAMESKEAQDVEDQIDNRRKK